MWGGVKASETRYGISKICRADDITADEGLVLGARERNPASEGTIANKIAKIRKELAEFGIGKINYGSKNVSDEYFFGTVVFWERNGICTVCMEIRILKENPPHGAVVCGGLPVPYGNPFYMSLSYGSGNIQALLDDKGQVVVYYPDSQIPQGRIDCTFCYHASI